MRRGAKVMSTVPPTGARLVGQVEYVGPLKRSTVWLPGQEVVPGGIAGACGACLAGQMIPLGWAE